MDEVDVFIAQLESDDFSTKRLAIEMLAQMDDERAIKPLLKVFEDDEWQIRNTAIDALISLNKDEIFPLLIELLNSENPSVRNSAISTLERMREKSVHYLKNGLYDKDVDIQIFTANTLGFIGSDLAAKPLLELLSQKNLDENVTFAVVEALGRIKCPSAVEPIIERLRNADVWDKFNYLNTLGEIGDERATETVLNCFQCPETLEVAIMAAGNIGDPLTTDLIIENLYHESHDVQKVSVKALLGIKRKILSNYRLTAFNYIWQQFSQKLKTIQFDKLEALIDDIFCGNDVELQQAMLKLLKFSSGSISGKYILKLLEKEELVEELVELYQIHSSISLEPYLDEMKKQDETFLVNLIHFANSCMITLPEEFLIFAIHHPYEDVVINTALYCGLQNAFTDKLFEVLIELLNHQDKRVRFSAEGALIMFPPTDTFNQRIKSFLKSSCENQLHFALRYIAMNDNGISIQEILPFLNSPLETIRAVTVTALKRFLVEKRDGFDEVIQKLLLMLHDESPLVQIEVIKSLGDYLEPSIVKLIEEVIEIADERVKIQGIKTISKKAAGDIDDYLVNLLKSESLEIQIIAIHAMKRCTNPEKILFALNEKINQFPPDIQAEAIEIRFRQFSAKY